MNFKKLIPKKDNNELNLDEKSKLYLKQIIEALNNGRRYDSGCITIDYTTNIKIEANCLVYTDAYCKALTLTNQHTHLLLNDIGWCLTDVEILSDKITHMILPQTDLRIWRTNNRRGYWGSFIKTYFLE